MEDPMHGQGKKPPDQEKCERSIRKPLSAYQKVPDDPQSTEILDARAQALSSSQGQEKLSTHQSEEYIRFFLGKNERYGIPYAFLEEIIPVKQLSRVPCTPTHIAGVTNWRGNLITVLLLHPFFGAKPLNSKQEKIIVVSHERMTLGIYIDCIDMNDTYNPELLVPPLPSQSVSKLEYIKGIYQGGVAILNLAYLLTDEHLMVRKINQ